METTLQISGTPAEIYEQHMVPAIFARWAPDLVGAAGVRTGQRVVDVACGTGAVARLLAERVGTTGKVTGLDVNPAMLAVARLSAPSQSIEWLDGSAVKMPLPDAIFDAVVCQQGLQFFPDRPAALSEMRRVLKPGGRLALSCWRSITITVLGSIMFSGSRAARTLRSISVDDAMPSSSSGFETFLLSTS